MNMFYGLTVRLNGEGLLLVTTFKFDDKVVLFIVSEIMLKNPAITMKTIVIDRIPPVKVRY